MPDPQQQQWPVEQREWRPIGALKAHERNARTHTPDQIQQVVASIRQWGWTNPIVVDEHDTILAGHARLAAAQAMGLTEVPVIVARNWSDVQKRAYLIADNKLGLNAAWDEELLALELREIQSEGFEVELTGFEDRELAAILGSTATSISGKTDPDAVPERPPIPTTAPGDLWLLGEHRLLCGDCRDFEVVRQVCAGQAVNLGFTSPPYAKQRDYDETSGFEPIDPDDYVEWFRPVAANLAAALARDGSWFINIKPAAEGLDTLLYVHDLVAAHVREWGWHFVTEYCWQRMGVPKNVARRFKNQFEPVYQFVLEDFKFRPEVMRYPSDSVPKPRGRGAGNTSWANHQGGGIGGFRGNISREAQGRPWSQWANKPEGFRASDKQGSPGFEWFGEHVGPGMAYPGNLLPTFAGTHTATGHTAAFPVGLPEWFIRAYTDEADVVLDPFAGSGSTMIACEGTGRRCCSIDLSALYCDVMVMRWQDFTGRQATLEGDGRSYADVRAARLSAAPAYVHPDADIP